jgi:cholest-4-en-3-one 26-monooxygenase
MTPPTATADLSLDDIDLLENTWAQAIPYDQFRLLRREAPVYWHDMPDAKGFWAVTKHADVKAISRDWETYSTELGSTFLRDFDEEAMALVRMTLLNMDPPRHTRYRRLVSAGFTPRMIKSMFDSVAEGTRRIIEDIEAHDGNVEFVETVAVPLPLQIICDMIGVPAEDRPKVFEWSNRLVGGLDPDFVVTETDQLVAQTEIYAYCEAIAADRRVSPRDDIMTALVQAEVDGDKMTDQELNLFFVLLCVAGNETTRNLISHAMMALIEHPEARAELAANVDDDALWNSATEEFLRWSGSIQNFRRTATRATEIRGQAIAEGDKVVIFYASANRDEEAFENPDTFDIHRSPNDHVTFGGGGTHFCLGANLARMEIRTMMRELLRRYPNAEYTGEPRRMRSDFINGIKYLPVQLS